MKIVSLIVLVAVLLGGVWVVSHKKQSSLSIPASTSQEPTGSTTPAPTASPGGSVLASEITLTITSPANGVTVSSASITIKGKTKANAEVFVNDEETRADASGNFSVKLTLDEGDNPIVISANDADGNFAEKEIMVNYDSGQ